MCTRAASPSDIERAQRFSDPSSARPVRNISRDFQDRLVCAPMRKLARDAGQARGKEKGFDAIHSTVGPPGGERVNEMKQHPGITLHRSADVAYNDQWTPILFIRS